MSRYSDYDRDVAIFKSSLLSNRITLAANVIYVYDTLLTLPTEITGVWGKPWTMSSVLYVANRYIYLLSVVTGLLASFGDEYFTMPCLSIMTISMAAKVTCQCLSACLFALRIYALYNRSTAVLFVLGSIILARLGLSILINFVELSPKSTSNLLDAGVTSNTACKAAYSNNTPGGISSTLLNSLLTVLDSTNLVEAFIWLTLDCVVFALTLAKTYRHAKTMMKLKQHSIVSVILRDGVVYFFIVFTIGSASTGIAAHFYVSHNDLVLIRPNSSVFLLTPFTNGLFVMFANRLYLNLRTWNDPRPGFSRSTHDLPTMNFIDRRVLGRIGAPMRTMDEDDELYADEYNNGGYTDGLVFVDGSAQVQDTAMVPVVMMVRHRQGGDIQMVPGTVQS